jgi:protein gp37
MNLENINWVIVGSESERKARSIEESWIWDIKQQCQEQGIAFFFKQWGGLNKKKSGRELGVKIYDEMPITEHMQTISL